MKTKIEFCYFSDEKALLEYVGLECKLEVYIPLSKSRMVIPLQREEPMADYTKDLVSGPLLMGNGIAIVREESEILEYIVDHHMLFDSAKKSTLTEEKNTVIADSWHIGFLVKEYAYLNSLVLSSHIELSSHDHYVKSCRIAMTLSNPFIDEHNFDIQEYFLNIQKRHKDFFLLHHRTDLNALNNLYYSEALTSRVAEHFLAEKKPDYAQRTGDRSFTVYGNALRFQEFQSTSKK